MRLIVLTKSSKFRNYCVAGIDVESGAFVRLVSDDIDTHGALTWEDIHYQNGTEMQVLDIIEVETIGRDRNPVQPENYIINREYYFELKGKATFQDLLRIHPFEQRSTILGNYNCYVPESDILDVGYSLTLIHVTNLTIHQVSNPFNAPKTKASFFYNGIQYSSMSVTDRAFYSVDDGTHYSEAALVVSVGTPYNGNYYKFVSAIFV